MIAEKSPFIALSGVTKSFGKGEDRIAIFSDLSLDIPRGDFVAIMGPSGSGKSTLLNLLAGLDGVEAGRVAIDGCDIGAMGEGDRAGWRTQTLGIVFQFLQPLAHADGGRERRVAVAPQASLPPERRERVETVLGLVGLSERARHYPRQMSGGQQQRVGIARAIVGDPALLLCDEPTGDLDRRSADEALEMLGLLNRDLGKTIVMVTHDPAAARAARRHAPSRQGRVPRRGPDRGGSRAMSFFRLMRLNAWRRPLRTVLMMLCVAVAFLIHGLGAGFLAGSQSAGGADESRLVIASRSGRAQPLPLSHFARIAADPDVASAAYSARIRGFVETERNVVVASAVDPAVMAATMGDELGLTPDLLAGLAGARDRVLVGRALAETMGWRVGQRVALTPFQTMRADGARTWSFEIGRHLRRRAGRRRHALHAGPLRLRERRPGAGPGHGRRHRHHAATRHVAGHPRRPDRRDVRKLRGTDADAVGEGLPRGADPPDRRFRPDRNPRHLGRVRHDPDDRGQHHGLRDPRADVRDRRPQGAGLLAPRVMALVLGETLFVFLVGGLAGLGLAKAGSLLLGAELGLALPPLVLAKAVLILLALGLVAGLVPAMQAMRMPIANALKSR